MGRFARVCAILGLVPMASSACGDDAPPSAKTTTGSETGAQTTGAGPTSTGAETTGEGDTSGGSVPPAPTLVSPADQAEAIPIQTALCWDLVEDPDGDALRYRVIVDDVELDQGITGEEGYEGPCTPLDLSHEQTYRWRVRAFEVDDPSRASDDSAEWTFTTDSDGVSTTVFEDDFSDDLGWQIEGDATDGAWIRGVADLATDGTETSQPDRCVAGSCYLTGHNPGGLPDQADVSEGSTSMTSPPLDLAGAGAATIGLSRFFYKSEAAPGPLLSVELLVPDDESPGELIAYPLEVLEAATGDAPANVWTPVEYAACDVPMRSDSRLRITATDDGPGILEAAIDSVSVHAHHDDTVCSAGEGSFCDPARGAAACPDPLICCARNVLNDGVYRCGAAVAGLDFDAPPASIDDPGNGPLGCDGPDMIVDPSLVAPLFTDILVQDDTCELLEGCVGGTGWRTVMLFTTAVPNIGSRDLVLGIPANNPDAFHYSECHDHYHFDHFADYQLLDGDAAVASGHKQAFCMLDTGSWAWPLQLPKFDCGNQGISRGFTDQYEAGLPCQWIDVTDVSPGDYTLRIELNPTRAGDAYPLLAERDYGNNVLELAVTVP